MIVSTFREMWSYENQIKELYPEFSGTRIMMMPVELGNLQGVPKQYWPLIHMLFDMTESRFIGQIGYLTIDERELQPNKTLRRAGLHVDGYYHGKCGAWGGGGGWGSVGNGMLVTSNTDHCEAYLGAFEGDPDPEGSCDHIDVSGAYKKRFSPYSVHWVDGACIHESLPVTEVTKRQFIRLSMPNNGPWFEGYTKNPSGIQPSGEILPMRKKFMKE